MSDTPDNVIPLKRGALNITSHSVPAPTEPVESVTDINPALAQMILAVAHTCDFLLNNKEQIAYFVAGVGLKPTGPGAEDRDVDFHAMTSPISMADFALALRMLDNTLQRALNGTLPDGY